eukprot:scaffold37840_cov58-Phaeocystis_antarctica.AAC.7
MSYVIVCVCRKVYRPRYIFVTLHCLPQGPPSHRCLSTPSVSVGRNDTGTQQPEGRARVWPPRRRCIPRASGLEKIAHEQLSPVPPLSSTAHT